MPENTNILMIRHAEKPETGTGLSVAGSERAQAYTVYFQNYLINQYPITPHYIFATKNSKHSHRPKHTVEPLATALGLSIKDHYSDSDYPAVVQEIRSSVDYKSSNILICWHHGELLNFADALGVNPASLPSTANWPSKWHGSVFGWVLQICYDASGDVNLNQTLCINEDLMYGDYGKTPPEPRFPST